MDVVHSARLDTSGDDPRERSICSAALAIMFYWLIVPEILASAPPFYAFHCARRIQDGR